MTLEPYDCQRLDLMALRILDLATVVRQMSHLCRENDVSSLSLHDKKALEWLSRLDDWARDGNVKLQAAVLKQKAQQRSRRVHAESADGKKSRKK